MRTCVIGLVLLGSATLALGQQNASVKLECRELPAGQALAQNETLMNGMACHVVGGQADAQSAVPSKTAPNAAEPGAMTEPVLAAPVQAPVSLRIASGSTVYIAPMDGFENYITAAFQKKNVPLVPVASEEQATYVLRGTAEEKKPGWAKTLMTGQIHSDNAASVQMIDRRSGAIVFAYSVDKKNTLHGQQTTAEACAKHLKDQIGKK